MKRFDFYVLLGIILAGFIVLIYLLNKDKQKDNVIVKLTYDSIPVVNNNSTIEKPVVYKAGEINIPAAQLNILQSTDTVLLRQVLHEVLARYYEINVQHTTTADTNLVVETWDTISENKLKGRKLQYKILRPTEITINPPVRNKVYIGASITVGQNGLYDISPQLSLALKKGTLIEVGYNTYALATGQDKYAFRFSLSQKIKLKK